MKKLVIFSLVALFSFMTMTELEARGGRGGGGGGGRSGGGSRSSSSIQRSPSMSRSSRPPSKARPQPSKSNIARNNASRGKVDRKPASYNPQKISGPTRDNIEQFRQTQSTQRPAQRTNVPSRPPSSIPLNRYQSVGRNALGNIKSDYPNRGNWFQKGFWDRHDIRPPYYNTPGNWWSKATAVGVASWLGWQSLPYSYYDYDDFGYGYGYGYDSSSPFLNDSSLYDQQNPVSLYDQKTQMVESIDIAGSNQWMPLGVFAIAGHNESAATPNMFMQLALNKAGAISGSFYNATTDQTHELVGSVDPQTQRATWKVANNAQSPIIETGVYNLTQNEAPIRVYFPNQSSEDKLLVRVES